MKQIMLISALVAAFASPLSAACYADYKAKRDDPLKLHYGVAELRGACDVVSAVEELRPRLAQSGWVLLNVLTVFDASGLEQRKDSAGQFFLRD